MESQYSREHGDKTELDLIDRACIQFARHTKGVTLDWIWEQPIGEVYRLHKILLEIVKQENSKT